MSSCNLKVKIYKNPTLAGDFINKITRKNYLIKLIKIVLKKRFSFTKNYVTITQKIYF